jgi:signal transduction histidine kinase
MEDKKTTATFSLGQRVSATVERIFPFGIFVRLPDGTEAHVRRREMAYDRSLLPEEAVSVGQQIKAVVIALPERDRRLELSIRQAEPDPWEGFIRAFQVRDTVSATVENLSAEGVWIQIVPGVDGFIPREELAPWPVHTPKDMLWIGDQVEAMITSLNRSAQRVRLSIRRQMVHEAEVQKITKQLLARESAAESLSEPEVPDAEPERVLDLHGLGRALVVDDDDSLRDGLMVWLQRHGCQADGVDRLNDGLAQVAQAEYSLIIVDLDLAGQDGLEFVRALRQNPSEVSVIVISVPDWIAERSRELEELAVVGVFTKPLDLDEMADTLARLAHGETVGPFRLRTSDGAEESRSAFQQLAQTMRSGTLLETRLEAALKELVRLTRAELCVFFHLDPISQQIEVLARAGHRPLKQEAVYTLTQSPVKDLILEGGEIYEARLSSHARKRFEKLLDAVEFESCIGVPVAALGRVEHALFLFHRESEAFSRYRLRDAHAMATLLAVALENQALEERIQAINPFLVSGQLAAGFGHDVFNKMSGLELQVLNLRADLGTLAGAERIPTLSFDQTMQDMEQVLETTLDLKRTIEAFQKLVRAESQVCLDANLVVTRSVSLLQSTARRAKVHIKTDLSPDLPPMVGNPVRLQQAFLNVMLNAIQHIELKRKRWPKGESRLLVTTGLESGSDLPLQVRFTDTGPGIHRKLWDGIFALGFSTREGGSGLGLFIARSLAESMGGQISVEQSTIPSGTTFLVELPAAQVREE